MKLNKSTSHAIRILVDCARAHGELVKVADLSQRLSITMQNVFKIVHILSRADLISAMRGRNGGVKLTRPAADIRVGDIVRAMESTELELEGDIDQSDAGLSRGVNSVLDSALEAFITILDQHTLADLAAVRKDRRAPKSKRRTKSVASEAMRRADARAMKASKA